jgi:plasmid stabilization system protein ParE
MKKFVVRFTEEAEADLLQMFDFLLDRDIGAAERAELAIAKAVELLEIFPFSCRKAGAGSGSGDTFLRELIIPFGNSGYVALFEIEGDGYVTILAVRHQREDDYH